MKKLFLSSLLTLLAAASVSLRADTTVVFNEIMYHPATNETLMEWVELRNQMAVDVDLSGWSISGGIQYTFASNTIVRGGGFVVVALSPATIMAATGATNVVGPSAGRLSNNGDTLHLRNNSGRVVDEVNYGTDGDWPVAPDGSGVSLAKRDRDTASGPVENWTLSDQVGGTPGVENFPVAGVVLPDTSLLAVDASWKYDASGANLGTAWRDPGYNDTAWASRANLTNRTIPGLFNTGVGANGLVLPNNTPDLHYVLTANANGGTGTNALAILNHPSWLANNATNSFIGVINPGNTTINGGNYNFQTTFSLAGFLPASAQINIKVAVDNDLTDVFINGAGSGLAFSGFAALSPALVISSGFVAGNNTLEFRTVNQGAGPGGFLAVVNGTGLAANTNSPLPLGPTTYYFRKPFTFSGNPAYTELRLNSVLADGAVVYLNGVEVYRQNMPAGPVTFATAALSDVASPNYSGLILIPAASLVVGANVLAVEVHQAAASADGPLYGTDLIATPLPVPPPVPVTIAFNEFSASTNAEFWLELVNYGTNSLPLEGCVLVRDGAQTNEYIFPAGPALGAGAYRAFTNTTFGFHPESGEKLYLYRPGKTNVIDAVVVKKAPRGRSPDGTGSYLLPGAPTPGGPNSFTLHNEIVINEIMYSHRDVPGTNGLPPTPSRESWLELYNKSASPVNLDGWELDGGITYRFFNKTIAPDGYLVVAKDAAYLRSIYPAIDIVGDFSKNLSGSSDTIILRDPSGNPANQVRYFDGGRWPGFAGGGGGSSLELRDPNADNSKAEAWAASNEAGKTPWQTYTNRIVAAASVTASPETTGVPAGYVPWREFVLGLLSDGECWIDDLSVVQSPTNGPIQLIANGNFESGLSGWRVLGNHVHSRVELDPDNAGNHVLHVVATGPQEHMHNHIETTLTAGRSVVNGTLYEISFRARHIAGNNLLNTRLYFNRVARTTALPTAALNGTPGARNSRYATNIGPTFAQFQHQRVVPQAGEAVTVSVAAQDPQGVSTCEVWWSANGGAWSNSVMAAQGGGLYAGTIPGLPAATVVQFYVRAVDGLGAVSTFPAAGPNSGALYKVNDGTANLALTHNVRIILTPANTALLHASTNVMSNDLLPCTVIYDESRPYYDMTVHLKSSERGRNDGARVGFHLVFPPDDLFRGVHPVMLIDRSDSGRPKGEEILLRHMALRAGVPMTHADICRVLAPQSAQTGQAIFSPRYEDEFMETAFDHGADGTLFELELIYYPTTASTDGYKLPQPDGVQGLDFSNVGDDKETYRYNFILKNHRNADDFSRLIAFAKSWSLSGATLEPQTRLTTDWDAWMRSYSLVSLMGVGDMYTFGNNHNLMAYQRPSDQKMVYFLWDMDFSFNRAAGSAAFIGDQNLGRIVGAVPSIQRSFYGHLLDHVNTVFNTAYMTYWFNRYDDFTLGQDFASGGGLTYIQQRGDFARSTIASVGGNAAFAVSGTNFIVTSNNLITLSGTAPVQIKTIKINGVEYAVTWTSVSSWTLRIPVSASSTVLNLVGYDVHGVPLTNFTTNVTVNYTGAAVPPPEGVVVFSEIMYDPAMPDASYIEIYNSSPAASFDVSGWRVNGLDYTFPTGSILTNRQYLVLAHSLAVYSVIYSNAALPFDQFDGALQNDGETLTLLRPIGTNGEEIVVDQVRYEAAPPWAAANGTGASLQLIDAAQDNSRVSNWYAQSPDWVYATYTGIIAPNGTNFLIFMSSPGGDVYIDDLVLVTNTVPGLGPNLLQNGGFEAPLSGTWTNLGNHSNSVASTAYSHSGSSSLHVVASGGGSATAAVLQNIAPLPANMMCTLSFWYRSTTNGSTLTIRTTLGSSFVKTYNIQSRPTPYSPGTNNTFTGTLPPYEPVWLNELQAENSSGPADNMGEREPWIELYNSGPTNIDLSAYYLADNYGSNLTQWQFPGGSSIAPGEFRLVWADGEPLETFGTNAHTNFRLRAGYGSVALVRLVDGAPQITDYLSYTNLPAGRSYGDFADGQPFSRQEFYRPTPGATNDNLAAPLVVFINEWMAQNTGALLNTNNNNKYDDWFEIHNPASSSADLTGYFLTDNLSNHFQFAIPSGYVIPPHGFLLVWADGRPGLNTNSDPALHVSFKLEQNGETIALFASDNVLIDAVSFGPQYPNFSEGRYPDGPAAQWLAPFTVATPGSANAIYANRYPVLPVLPDATAYVNLPFQLNAAATDPDAPPQMLAYTLDAGAPTNATLNATTGAFAWTPVPAQTDTTNVITVRVTDNGTPVLAAARTFQVIVRVPLLLGGITHAPNGDISFTVGTIVGKTYRVEYKDNLNTVPWTQLVVDQVAMSSSLTVMDNIGVNPQRFYRVTQVE